MSKPNPEKPLLNRAREWLERSGLPLEMEAARAFLDTGFEVTQGQGYVDAEEKKGREIDVLARDHDKLGLLQILVAVECKSSDKPWLVLKAQERSSMNRNRAFGLTSKTVTAEAFHLLYREEVTYQMACSTDDAGYGFREVFSEGRDRAYGAAMSAANACVALINSSTYAPPRFVFAIPIVVVDSPLFEAHLTLDGSLTLNEVSMSQFVISSVGPTNSSCLVRVVTRDSLKGFAKALNVFSKSIKGALQPEVDRWVNTTQAGKRKAAEARLAQHRPAATE